MATYHDRINLTLLVGYAGLWLSAFVSVSSLSVADRLLIAAMAVATIGVARRLYELARQRGLFSRSGVPTPAEARAVADCRAVTAGQSPRSAPAS